MCDSVDAFCKVVSVATAAAGPLQLQPPPLSASAHVSLAPPCSHHTLQLHTFTLLFSATFTVVCCSHCS